MESMETLSSLPIASGTDLLRLFETSDLNPTLSPTRPITIADTIGSGLKTAIVIRDVNSVRLGVRVLNILMFRVLP